MSIDLATFEHAFVRVYAFLRERDRMTFLGSDAATRIACSAARALRSGEWPELRASLAGPEFIGPRRDADAPFEADGLALRLGSRVALAMATVNPALLRPGERELVEAIGGPAWGAAAPDDPTPDRGDRVGRAEIGDTIPVTVAAFFKRAGRAGRRTAYNRFDFQITIPVVDPDVASKVFHLSTPDGGSLPVIKLGEQILRPVMAPFSWRPISLERFASAMRSGEPWRDHPAAVLDGQYDRDETRIVLHVDDLADPDPIRSDREVRARDERAERIRDRCAGLVCLDGIVYRPTPAPQLRLLLAGHQFGRRAAQPALVSWECGDLRAWADPHVLRPRRVDDVVIGMRFPVELEPLLRGVASALGGDATEPLVAGAHGRELPLETPSALRAVTAAYNEMVQRQFGTQPPTFGHAVTASADFARACAAEDREAALRAAAAMERVMRRFVMPADGEPRNGFHDWCSQPDVARAILAIESLAHQAARALGRMSEPRDDDADIIGAAFAT